MHKMNKVCIVQARLGSKRLPSKVLKKINGKPMIYWLIKRLNRVKNFNLLVLAIPKKNNNKLYDYLKTLESAKIKIFRGPEKNVLKRFYLAAKKYSANTITRVTADDPLKDIKLIENSLTKFTKSNLDYYSNTIKQTFPIGIDIEHFTFKTLDKAYKSAVSDYDKEHVTHYMITKPKQFKIKNFVSKIDLSNFRLTVDTKSDFVRIRKIFIYFKKNPFIGYRKIIKYLKKNEI